MKPHVFFFEITALKPDNFTLIENRLDCFKFLVFLNKKTSLGFSSYHVLVVAKQLNSKWEVSLEMTSRFLYYLIEAWIGAGKGKCCFWPSETMQRV